MLVKCRILDQVSPAEAIIEIATREGREQVVLFPRLVKADAIEVGSVLASQEDFRLVELPRETTSGKWRVWVSQSEVLETA